MSSLSLKTNYDKAPWDFTGPKNVQVAGARGVASVSEHGKHPLPQALSSLNGFGTRVLLPVSTTPTDLHVRCSCDN